MCVCLGFPDSAVGKESTCNAGDTGSIPGLGRFTGEGIGYLLQYSWASLVAQLVRNPHSMWETWVGSLSWEDPLEKGKATHSSVLAWRSPVVKNLSATAGEPRGGGSIPGLGRPPGEGNSYPPSILA